MFNFFSMLDNSFMISPFNTRDFYNFQYDPVHGFANRPHEIYRAPQLELYLYEIFL